MEHKRDFRNNSKFEDEYQVEGIYGITNEKSKYCSKCDYVDNTEKVKFCPNDGTQLKQFEPIVSVLDTELQFGHRIIYELGQYIDTTAQNMFTKFGSFASIIQHPNYVMNIVDRNASIRRGASNPALNPTILSSDYPDLLNLLLQDDSNVYSRLKNLEIKVKRLIGKEKIRDILCIMIKLRMKNPIIRHILTFKCDKQFMDRAKCQLTEDIKLLTTDNNVTAIHSNTLIHTSEGIALTDTDKKLRSLMMEIKEDIFYSKRNNKIYLLSELIEIFKIEGRVIKNLNFKERSKHIKILNVNAYILNEEVDQLFEFVEFRQKINKFNRFELNFIPTLSLMMLLGFNS